MFERWFRLQEHGTSVAREAAAGLATFLTMAYILVLNPQILSGALFGAETGLSVPAVLLATALSAAITSIAMGLFARLPIALAPGMGQNFFFASTVGLLAAQTSGVPWQVALGVVFWAGVLFVIVSISPIRQLVIEALSASLRHAIAAGIGLFIALIGLRFGGLLDPASLSLGLQYQNITTPTTAIFATGFAVTLVLHLRRVPGSILVGIVAAAAVATLYGQIDWPDSPAAWVGLPSFARPAAFQLDLWNSLSLSAVPLILVFFFMDLFDTTGTLIGVGQQAKLLDDQGQLPEPRNAFLTDSLGTVLGALLGTSPVTCYIESAAGVEQGGRTGLTAVVVGLLFALALVFSPTLVAVAGCQAVAAAALVIVGAMMAGNLQAIDWDDRSEALPAFLIVLGIPLFFSIADGLALGLICYPLAKIVAGQARRVNPIAYVLAVVLLGYFLFLRPTVL